MHPNGALPAYEWAFDDVNPPVHAWAGGDGSAPDRRAARPGFLGTSSRSCCSTSPGGSTARTPGAQPLRGGLPGPGQHRPLRPLAPPGQGARWSSRTARPGWPSTAWPCGDGPGAGRGRPPLRGAGDQVPGALPEISAAMNRIGAVGRAGRLLLRPPGRPRPAQPLEVRSIVGVFPPGHGAGLGGTVRALPHFERPPRFRSTTTSCRGRSPLDAPARGAAPPGSARSHLRRLLAEVLDEDPLCPYGLRSLSRHHAAPLLSVRGRGTVDYEPAESHLRPLRGQLQLARPRVVPPQLPGGRGPGALPRLRGRLHRGVPHRLRADADPAGWPASCAGA